MLAPAITIRTACWSADRAALQAIRTEVFVIEQQVPVELEWDDIDAACVHLIAESADGQPAGCVRLLPDGHVGRMAVRRAWRGRGIGRALLQAVIERAAADGLDTLRLNAQTPALGFYRRQGFEAFGPEFDEAGIAHWAMRRTLAPS